MTLVVAVIGVALSIFIALGARSRDQRRLEADLDRVAYDRVRAIEQALVSAVNHVESVAALVGTEKSLDRETFSAFASPLLRGHGAIQALGYNPVVKRSERRQHEQTVRDSGYPDYRITERDLDGRLVPAAEREDYVVAAFLEPLAGNEAALGYDISSEPVRREALDRARAAGQPAITGRLTLVQQEQDGHGALVFVPVDADGSGRIVGYGVGVIGIGRLVKEALRSLKPAGINLDIHDESDVDGGPSLYYHRSRTLAEDGPRDTVAERTVSYGFEIAGRRWRIDAIPTTAFVDSHRSIVPVMALVAGLLLTGGLVGYLYRQGATNDRLRLAIAERERAEERLTSFGRVLDEAHNEIYVFDANSLLFLNVNRGARENLGYSMDELRKMTPLDLKTELTSDAFEVRLQPLREGRLPITDFTARHRRKDGSFYDVEVHLQLSEHEGRPAFAAVILDITERLEFEQQMRQAQRLEALGTLAGGMAHDVNNLLMAIMGHAELGVAKAPADSPAHRHFDEVLRASERARDVVRQILTFSRRNPVERRALQLGEVLEEALGLIRASLPKNIEVRTDLATAGTTEGDASQIHQVLINLCTNAAHAMAGRDGLLEVWVDKVDFDRPTAETLGGLEPGGYSRISVRDNGPGIPPEVLNRIFDPFFTTKARGEGTGMGLAVAHGIVRNHGGTMVVSSEVGRGTTFEVFLPIAGEHVEVAQETREAVEARGERILLVEDEPAVADVLCDMLRHEGYRVEAREDAEDALQVLQVHPEEFDLVITDYSMPKMNGTTLAESLSRQPAAPPVILVSGYGELVDEEAMARARIRELLTKPIRRVELNAAIRRVLDG